MALVLGVENGERFFIGRRQLDVVSIDSPARITLRRDDGRMFTVTRHEITEVFKDVLICTGPWQPVPRPRLVFDAPQTVLIRRAGQVCPSRDRLTNQLEQSAKRHPAR